MFKKWRLTDRTRTLLTLELAISLPAAALMAFSIWNLKHIQRDQAIEAAMLQDFSYVLKIAEKRSLVKANDIMAPVREEFPTADDGPKVEEKLDHVLREHPEFSYAMLYDKKKNLLVSRMQPARHDDAEFCARTQNVINSTQDWVPMEASMMAGDVRAMEEKDESPIGYYGNWSAHVNQHPYWNVAYFVPSRAPKDQLKDQLTVGVVSFDTDYLREKFMPTVMTDVLNSKVSMLRSDEHPPAMMIHSTKDDDPWVASENWDGGKPEMERKFESVFPNLILSIKYPGTTIADMGARFLHYNYAVLAALSLLMAGGIFLTYRNISRELNLARLKSDFVANVSHELRTPLALIRLYAETLELGRINAQEKYHEYYRIIREESERLTSLINNILDFSRIEAGGKEYDFKETNLGELVRSTLDSYRFQIQQNGFVYEENISTDVPPVNVDREAIARSLLNLINNALKYSKEQKYIGVNLYRANGSVKLEVQDHGIGIPPAEQEKIFEKFYRCGDPLVHNIKGSGLGLSLVRHIARAHGGDVSVESAPEKGSKFTIALPIDSASKSWSESAGAA
jgi:signal transduction histidine kinase